VDHGLAIYVLASLALILTPGQDMLYVISRSDKLFPPSIAPDVMDKLAKAGVNAKYFEIDTDFGHSATGVEWAKWGPTLKAFVEGLSK